MNVVESRNPQRRQGQRALDVLAADYLHLPGVAQAPMFGSNALRRRGKVFAFVGAAGELVVKVPSVRAAELVADGVATRVRIGRNPAREWVGVPLAEPDDQHQWRDLLAEAYRYLSALQDD